MSWAWALFVITLSITIIGAADVRKDGRFAWLSFIVMFFLIDIPILLFALRWI